jgi:predicted outer membrane repeat protein
MTRFAQARNSSRNSLEPLESRIAPAIFMVTSLADDGSAGTLRSEVTAANTAGGTNTITFSHSLHGQILLTSGEGGAISISSNLTIDGPGGNKIIIQGDGSAAILSEDNNTLTLKGLGFTDGNSSSRGGAIYCGGTLTIEHCVISGSQASDAVGGGIADITGGKFTMIDSRIVGNSATGSSGEGGGVFVDAGSGVVVTGCTFSGNSASSDGGGLEVEMGTSQPGSVQVANCLFVDNSSSTHGGGLFLYDGTSAHGQITLEKSIVTGNTATSLGAGIYINNHSAQPSLLKGLTVGGNSSGGAGGGLADDSSEGLTIQASKFVGNYGGGDYGGGLTFEGAHNVTIQSSTVLDNVSAHSAGGIAVVAGMGNFTMVKTVVSENSSPSFGAIDDYTHTGNTTISGCVLANNTSNASGGGGYIGHTTGTITIANTQVTGNVARDGHGGGLILDSFGDLTLNKDTVTNNTTTLTGSYLGGGLDILGSGTFTISASSIADNFASGEGGGIAVSGSVAGTIESTSITGNISSAIGGGFAHNGTGGIIHIVSPALVTGNIGAEGDPNFFGAYETP